MNYEEEVEELKNRYKISIDKILQIKSSGTYDGEKTIKLKELDKSIKRELIELKEKYGITNE